VFVLHGDLMGTGLRETALGLCFGEMLKLQRENPFRRGSRGV